MPKKKKHPRLPNGYGSIRYLGGHRSLPYAVHPPATDRNSKGEYIRPAALCYVPDWYTGFAVLSAYHAGTYKPGLELDLTYDRSDVDGYIRKLITHSVYQYSAGTTFETAYLSFMDMKFGENAPRRLSEAAKNSYKQGWNYLKILGSRPIDTISVTDLQTIINNCDLKQASKENIKMTAQQIFRHAVQYEMCEKDPSKYLVIPAGGEDEHGIPFTDAELVALWEHRDRNAAKVLLILCYSGFRVGALQTLEINTDEWYFKGGIKTKASKNRIVPIHPGIRDLVTEVDIKKPAALRREVNKLMADLGMNHTPHDCRHTFSALCERYGVNEADRKRMLGHSFGSDITNGIYGHRTLEELSEQLNKIPFCV